MLMRYLEIAVLLLLFVSAAFWWARRWSITPGLSWPWLVGVPIAWLVAVLLPVNTNSTLQFRLLIVIVAGLLFSVLMLTARISALSKQVSILAQQMAIMNLDAVRRHQETTPFQDGKPLESCSR